MLCHSLSENERRSALAIASRDQQPIGKLLITVCGIIDPTDGEIPSVKGLDGPMQLVAAVTEALKANSLRTGK